MSKKRYTAGEEIANSSSHGLGILLGIIAGIILMRGANQTNNSWIIISFAIYLVGMLSSYITSTWYHVHCMCPIFYNSLFRKKANSYRARDWG